MRIIGKEGITIKTGEIVGDSTIVLYSLYHHITMTMYNSKDVFIPCLKIITAIK